MSQIDAYWKDWRSRLRYLTWLNLVCMATGVVYAACPQAWPGKAWFDSAAFILYLVTLLSDSLAAYVFHERSRLAAELFCLASVLGMMAMLYGNFSASNNYSVSGEGILASRLIALVGYLLPLISAVFFLHRLQKPTAGKRLPVGLRILMAVPLVISIINFFLAGVKIFSGGRFHLLELVIQGVALFPAFIFLAEGIWLVCLLNASVGVAWRRGLLGAGLATFILFMLPILLTPAIIVNSERNFTETFHAPVFSPDAQRVFRPSRFDGMSYLLGVKPETVRMIKNVEYYREETGTNAGVRLCFDAFRPKGDPQALPGKGSVLIRVHGGAWMFGDKGPGNVLQMDKYFAAQGYIVFDLQYGLRVTGSHLFEGLTPKQVKGVFSADDMVQQIGIFTKYLAAHTSEYGANLDSVFISGGSAGGQLTGAVGLAITSKKYPDWFAEGIHVRGIIPFYPAFKLLKVDHIPGSAAIDDPSVLIDSNSPPCLIFQGEADALVSPKIPADFCQAYREQSSQPATVLSIPLAGHATDMYFPGNYNQIFLYYMERFMAMYR
jgi:acetyl esterase/lipase